MSYALVPYLIDLKKLTAAAGSKDKRLVDAVVKAHLKAFEESGSGGEKSLRDALTELVMGDELDSDYGHVYGYALEKVCRHLGKRLDVQYWDATRTDALEDTGVERLLEESGSPVPLPRIFDFPSIGHIPADKIKATLKDMRERLDDCGDADLRDLLKEFVSWLEDALSQKKALMLFYY
jgi:hypothetical protein